MDIENTIKEVYKNHLVYTFSNELDFDEFKFAYETCSEMNKGFCFGEEHTFWVNEKAYDNFYYEISKKSVHKKELFLISNDEISEFYNLFIEGNKITVRQYLEQDIKQTNNFLLISKDENLEKSIVFKDCKSLYDKIILSK